MSAVEENTGLAAAVEAAGASQVSELEHLRKERDGFRDQRNAVFETNERLLAGVQESDLARLRAENETRTVKREVETLLARVAGLKAKRADEHDELALALGRSNGTEWGDLIEFAAGAVSVEAKWERHRAELTALRNDALNMRGALSPNGEARKVPMPLGETLLPAVEWLIGRVAELEAERHTTNEALDDAVKALREREQRDAVVADFVAARAEYITAIRNCHPDNGHDYDRWQGHAAARRQLAELLGLPVAWPPEDNASVAKSADKLTRMLAPTQVSPEDPHDSPLYHRYETGRDLPEGGGR